MRVASRCYRNGKDKPHIGLTFKFDLESEDQIDQLMEDFREFVEDRFERWQEIVADDEANG